MKQKVLLSLFTVLSLNAMAQATIRDSVMLRNSEVVADEDVWLTRGNAAGLTRYSAGNISWADMYLKYGRGGFVNYNESPRDLRFGVDVESFYRLSKRTVVSGGISYDNLGQHDMTGSTFIAPERYPFDIVEDSLTNPGKIHRDTYHLFGGVGVDVWRGWSLGAKFDFTAANAAKYKDLRHKNSLMNIDATFGIYLPIAKWLSFGANYRYLRHSESLDFSTYARIDLPYQSLIDFGGMIGKVEEFGDNGLTDRSVENPLFFDGHGYGLQAELRLAPGLTWFNSWDMSYLKGYYGKNTPYTIVYMRHQTHRYLWTTRVQYRTKSGMHNLDASIENEKLDNYQNQYRNSANEHGARFFQYFQPLKTADKVWVNTHIGYTSYFGFHGEEPTWLVAGGVNINYRKLSSYVYPYYRRQHWTSTEGYLRGARNIFLKNGIITAEVGFSYKKGKGDPYNDGTFVPPSDLQSPPEEMTAFLYREYAFRMAPQYTINVAAKYAFIFPWTLLKSYVKVAYDYSHCNEPNEFVIGKQHWNLGVTLGVQF